MDEPSCLKYCSKSECSVTEIGCGGGRFHETEYDVFPGIQLVYNAVHIDQITTNVLTRNNVIEINHCREGRMECHYGDEFCYAAPGDLVIGRTSQKSNTTHFPLNHYHGITVRIDIDKAPQCLSCLLDDVNVEPRKIAEKFCAKRGCFAARSNMSVEHIFSELYSVPKKIRNGYFKIKVLELLLFLSVFDIELNGKKDGMYSKSQVELAKSVSEYLTKNLDKRVTIEQVSRKFLVSATQIKNVFKGVYGVSFYSYIKSLKMEAAAYMLEHTDKTVTDIAGEHGYDNSSKFANAFRAVKGVTPSEYRRQNQK